MECVGDFYLNNFSLKRSSEFNDSAFNNITSIYEVVRIEKGIALFLESHLNRLFNSADISGFNINESYCDFEKLFAELINKNKIQNGKIKLIIQFGDDNSRNETDFFIYFTSHYFPTDEEYKFGVKTGLCKTVRINPNAKILNTNARLIANNTIAEKKLFEVLLLDQDGYIAEGSRSNVFFIKNNSVITPPAKDVLIGITRTNIINLCNKNNILLIEEKIHLKDLKDIDAVFISGTSLKVLPVNSIDEFSFDTQHYLLKSLLKLYNQLVADYIKERLT